MQGHTDRTLKIFLMNSKLSIDVGLIILILSIDDEWSDSLIRYVYLTVGWANSVCARTSAWIGDLWLTLAVAGPTDRVLGFSWFLQSMTLLAWFCLFLNEFKLLTGFVL